MKFSLATVGALCAAVQGHTIFQELAVNGQDAGHLAGLRAPAKNTPVLDLTSNSLICGAPGSTSSQVINVEPGDSIGMYWQHTLDGSDPDSSRNPISASHHGPTTAYLAKVDNAASSPDTGLSWFKVFEDGYDPETKTWGIDHMIANNGWVTFSLPSCISPGQYLLRGELIALHNAKAVGQAQFYVINMGGSGTFQPSSSDTVSFPGAYHSQDPGILINIYKKLTSYTVPGPAPIEC